MKIKLRKWTVENRDAGWTYETSFVQREMIWHFPHLCEQNPSKRVTQSLILVVLVLLISSFRGGVAAAAAQRKEGKRQRLLSHLCRIDAAPTVNIGNRLAFCTEDVRYRITRTSSQPTSTELVNSHRAGATQRRQRKSCDGIFCKWVKIWNCIGRARKMSLLNSSLTMINRG